MLITAYKGRDLHRKLYVTMNESSVCQMALTSEWPVTFAPQKSVITKDTDHYGKGILI